MLDLSPVKILILILIWVFAGRTCHFVGFVMHWLIFDTLGMFGRFSVIVNYHYKNIPIQIYWKFYRPKNEKMKMFK